MHGTYNIIHIHIIYIHAYKYINHSGQLDECAPGHQGSAHAGAGACAELGVAAAALATLSPVAPPGPPPLLQKTRSH